MTTTITPDNLIEKMKESLAMKKEAKAKRDIEKPYEKSPLYKSRNRKPLYGKSKPSDALIARNRRVVIVSETLANSPRLLDALYDAGVLADTTGEIVSVTCAGNVITLSN